MDALKTALEDLGDAIICELERLKPTMSFQERRKTDDELAAARAIMAALSDDGTARRQNGRRQRTPRRHAPLSSA